MMPVEALIYAASGCLRRFWSRFQVSANQADGAPGVATISIWLHSEGPRVYKGAHPGDQNGNPSE